MPRPLLRSDQMQRRFACQGTQAVQRRAPDAVYASVAGSSGIMRRADDVRKIKEGKLHLEPAVPYRFDPPRVAAGNEVSIVMQMIVKRLLLAELAACHVDDACIIFH